MIPTTFPQANKKLLAPKGMEDNCGTLPVYCDGKLCISCWNLTWKERLKLLWTGNLWVYIISGQTQPPIALDVENPWKKE